MLAWVCFATVLPEWAEALGLARCRWLKSHRSCPPHCLLLVVQMRSSFYAPYARRLASWGFLVVQYDTPLARIITDQAEVGSPRVPLSGPLCAIYQQMQVHSVYAKLQGTDSCLLLTPCKCHSQSNKNVHLRGGCPLRQPQKCPCKVHH